MSGTSAAGLERRAVTARASTDTARDIPEATVARLPVYLRALTTLGDEGVGTCSSEELAAAAGVNSAKLRKDLSYLGSYGTRGRRVRRRLPALPDRPRDRGRPRTGPWSSSGSATSATRSRTSPASAAAASGWSRCSTPMPTGTASSSPVSTYVPSTTSSRSSREHGVAIGVIATPALAAQAVADRMVEAGISSILNFAPVVISVPERRRRPQGRPLDRAPDPRLPRAAQGPGRRSTRHERPGRWASPTTPRRSPSSSGSRPTPRAWSSSSTTPRPASTSSRRP